MKMNVQSLAATAKSPVINEEKEETDSESSDDANNSEDPYDIPDKQVGKEAEPVDPGEELVLEYMATKYKWRKWLNDSLVRRWDHLTNMEAIQ